MCAGRRAGGRRAATPLLLTACCLLNLLHRANGGDCWVVGKNGRCTDLLKTGVAQKECCALEPLHTAWSPHQLQHGRLFFWRALAGGVPCKPCQLSCKGVRCPEGRRCRVRAGAPRCVCAPRCGRRRARRGPVCGSDGRTYPHLCRLKRRQCADAGQPLRLAYRGPCRATCEGVTCASAADRCVLDQNRRPHCVPCLRPCPAASGASADASDAVCGVDGVTYTSSCHARRAACLRGRAIPIAYHAPCQPNATCTTVQCQPGQRCLLVGAGAAASQPSGEGSGGDGLAEAAGTDDTSWGPAVAQARCTSCPPHCRLGSRSGRTVCGTDGVTHRSWCHLMTAACTSGRALDVLHAGPCHAPLYLAENEIDVAGEPNDTASDTFAAFPFLLSPLHGPRQ